MKPGLHSTRNNMWELIVVSETVRASLRGRPLVRKRPLRAQRGRPRSDAPTVSEAIKGLRPVDHLLSGSVVAHMELA